MQIKLALLEYNRYFTIKFQFLYTAPRTLFKPYTLTLKHFKMKQLKFFSGITLAFSLATFLFSCDNSSEEKNTTVTTAPDTSSTTKMEPAPAKPEKPGNFLLTRLKVANYAKWKIGYDSHDSVRLANGLTNFVLGRGIGADSNTVLIALKMADVAKAKAMAASPELKARMQKGGVVGMPNFNFVETTMLDNATNATTTRVMMTHKVKDWDAWKKEFDTHKQVRMDAGLLDRAVGHSVDDSHMVTLVFAVTDMDKAKAFMASKDLKDKMAAAGVEGAPTVFFYTVAQTY